MTNKEAADLINAIIQGNPQLSADFTNALQIAKRAVENHVPKIFILGGEKFCPNCDNHEIYPTQNFCNKCGQALDWSEEKCTETHGNARKRTETHGKCTEGDLSEDDEN